MSKEEGRKNTNLSSVLLLGVVEPTRRTRVLGPARRVLTVLMICVPALLRRRLTRPIDDTTRRNVLRTGVGVVEVTSVRSGVGVGPRTGNRVVLETVAGEGLVLAAGGVGVRVR